MWKEVRVQGDKWCDGLTCGGQSHKKRKWVYSDDEADLEEDKPKKKSDQEEREEKVKKALDKKHGSNYTQMQYRI